MTDTTTASAPRPRRLSLPRPAPLHLAVTVLGALLVAAAHFRPWEVAFLEEWPLSVDFTTGGSGAFTSDYGQWTLSRPLHLVLTELGLALGGGAPGAIFIVLAAVAVAQFLVVIWTLRAVSRAFWLPTAIAFVVAMHPLWPGGFLQRFLPAQTAALAFFIAAGLILRWLLRGQVRWIVAAALTLLVGLLVYPGPAVAAPLLAVVLALAVRASWRRRIVTVVVITATCAFMTLYSLVITMLIDPGGESYEAGNIAVAAVRSPRELVTYVAHTYLGSGLTLVAGILALAVLGAVLALSGVVSQRMGWLITGVALVSPATSIVYFGHVGWLQDIDRLGYVATLALVAGLLLWPLTSTGARPRVQTVIAIGMLLVTAVGVVRGIQHWQPSMQTQKQLLAELKPIVKKASGDEIVVVIDHSGTYGTQFTFPLQYLGSASRVMNQDSTPVWLCFDSTDPYQIPGGGVECDPDDTGTDLRLQTVVHRPGGDVDIYLSRKDSDD
ncbi:hypothetical protein GCM10027515_01260 [Schumannella luteola]|uniref:Glycosyltransferase RgtA/B/C/D-like domain-containing protein n=1 Tax=Schumannella luteola TaxID=472059 RepID=A0A852YBS2_9MICO|nr:hypothetical protein [Schumannella luteola]NYG98734.1 hypothetical protein [Schumannella luteola]TPX04317.1 hypothetical protein FJ656_12715 [Schumannella luteola]